MSIREIVSIITSDFRKIPPTIRLACFNVALFSTGWGFGTDPMYSIFVQEITNNLFLVGGVSALLSFIKMLLTLPVGELDGQVDERKMLTFGKIIYMLAGTSYFFAGYLQSMPILILAIVLNGLGGPFIYTTYQSYIRQHSNEEISCKVFGLYNAYFSVSYCGAALISAFFIEKIQLFWFYIAVVFFALISIPMDWKLEESHNKPIMKELYNVIVKDSVYIRVLRNLKQYDFHLYFTLLIQFMWGLLDYVSFIFVPILALTHSLTLMEITIVFALMRFPYLLSFFFAEIADKKERMGILGGSLLITACLLATLSQMRGFMSIILISIAVSLCLAIIRPTVAGVLTNLTNPSQRSEITGVQDFLTMSGQVIGAFFFGVFSQMYGIEITFIGLAILVGLLGISTFIVRSYHKKFGIMDIINIPMGIFHFHPHFSRKNRELNQFPEPKSK